MVTKLFRKLLIGLLFYVICGTAFGLDAYINDGSFFMEFDHCIGNKLKVRWSQPPEYVGTTLYRTTNLTIKIGDNDVELFRTNDRSQLSVEIDIQKWINDNYPGLDLSKSYEITFFTRYLLFWPVWYTPSGHDRQSKVHFDFTPPNTPQVKNIIGSSSYQRTDNNYWYIKNNAGSYAINWDEVSDVGGSSISIYQFQISNFADFSDNPELNTRASWGRSGTFATTTEGALVYVRLRAIDNVGNVSPWSTVSFIPDNSPPSAVSVNKIYGYNNVYPTNTPTVNSGSEPVYVDSSSGLSFDRSSDSVDASVGVNPSGYRYYTNRAGRRGNLYAAYVVSSDYLNSESVEGTPFYYYVDTISPTFDVINHPPSLSFVQPAAGSDITQINVTWSAASDNGGSGVKQYKYYYKANNSGFQEIPSNKITVSTTGLSAAIDVSSFSRDIDNNITVAVTAVDNLSHESDKTYCSSILLPAKLNINRIVTSLAYPADSYNSTLLVKVYLDVLKNTALTNYSQIQFFRNNSSETGKTALPSEVTSQTTAAWDISKINNAEDCYEETETINGVTKTYLVCVDRIPATSGAGHKYINYSIKQSPINSTITETRYSSLNELLPNHPGYVTITFTDHNNKRLSFDKHGEKIIEGDLKSDPDFFIDSDAAVNVTFTGHDIDKEQWELEFDSITREYTGESYLQSFTKLSGETRIKYGETTPSETYSATFPVILNYGVNALAFYWDEGKETEGQVKNNSAVIQLNVDPKVVNGFSIIKNSENGKYGPAGITVRPGQPLSLEVGVKPDVVLVSPSYVWIFGDDTEKEYTKSIVHEYDQKSGTEQLEDHCTYTLSVTATNNGTPTPFNIPVTVLDTQIGQLYRDEVWRGDHEVRGSVIVPSGKTLTIGASYLNSDMTVKFTGGVAAGYLQSIIVKSGGNLIVNNASNTVTFTKNPLQTKHWGSLYIENGGHATITKAIIQYADRAITAVGGAVVNITNSILKLNKTGLHIFGSSTVTLASTVIKNNTLYGIKEERNATPTFLSGNHIFSNFRNYYKWNAGLLKLSQLNAISPDLGTAGE